MVFDKVHKTKCTSTVSLDSPLQRRVKKANSGYSKKILFTVQMHVHLLVKPFGNSGSLFTHSTCTCTCRYLVSTHVHIHIHVFTSSALEKIRAGM